MWKVRTWQSLFLYSWKKCLCGKIWAWIELKPNLIYSSWRCVKKEKNLQPFWIFCSSSVSHSAASRACRQTPPAVPHTDWLFQQFPHCAWSLCVIFHSWCKCKYILSCQGWLSTCQPADKENCTRSMRLAQRFAISCIKIELLHSWLQNTRL